jgi:hypothetical protein
MQDGDWFINSTLEGAPLGRPTPANDRAALLSPDHHTTLQEGLHAAVSQGWGCDSFLKFDYETNLLSVK